MKKSLVLFLVFALICTACAVVLAASFTDIEGHWAESYIEKSTKEKIISGYEDGTFGPDDNIDRAEFVTLICRIFEPSSKADLSTYKDLSKDAWYYDYFAGAISMGVFNGDSNESARPSDNIKREEAIVMLNRILKYEPTSKEISGDFTDVKKVSKWAKDAMAALIEKGYIIGYEDNTLRPQDKMTRAEAVKMINKAIGLIITDAGEYDLTEVEGDVVVKTKGVTLTGAEGKKVFVPTPDIKADVKAKDVPASDIIVISEVEEEVKVSRGGSGSSKPKPTPTPAGSVAIILVPNDQVYDIVKSGDVEPAEGVKVTVIVSGDEQETIIDDLEIKEANLDSFKEQAKAAFDGILDEQKVINTLNNIYGDDEKVRAWGKKTATSSALTEEEAQIVNDYLDALTPEERATILGLYTELMGMKTEENRVATVAIDELTYEEALELISVVQYK